MLIIVFSDNWLSWIITSIARTCASTCVRTDSGDAYPSLPSENGRHIIRTILGSDARSITDCQLIWHTWSFRRFSFSHRCDGIVQFARWKRANAQTEMQSVARLYRVRTWSHAYQYVLLHPADMCIVRGTNVHQHTPTFVITIAFESALDSLPCRCTARITN